MVRPRVLEELEVGVHANQDLAEGGQPAGSFPLERLRLVDRPSDPGLHPVGQLRDERVFRAEVRADTFTRPEKLETLEELQPGAFSSCAFAVGERHITVYNPFSSPGRTQSEIAHEIAHS